MGQSRRMDLDTRIAQLTALVLDQSAALERLQAELAEARQQTTVDTSRQIQALVQLLAVLRPERPLPPLGGWAASPDLLLHLVDLVKVTRPATVLECGSGSTTLALALAIDRHDLPTRVVSLDHDDYYADQTRATLAEHGVAAHATVLPAPLVPTGLEGHATRWYDVRPLAALPPFDPAAILVVDGPPGTTGPLARYPALPLLAPYLADGATVLLDDQARDDEQQVTARWLAESPDAAFTSVDLLKGLGVVHLP